MSVETVVQLLNASVGVAPSIHGAESNLNSLESQYITVARLVFTHEDCGLTNDGRLMGLILLKNTVFTQQHWQRLDTQERDLFRCLILEYLCKGFEPTNRINQAELTPRVGPCIVELVARLVHNEWPKGNCPETFWHSLIEWYAWVSIRSSLRKIAGFRLPFRRQLFFNLVKDLIPVLFLSWKQYSDTEHITACVELSRTLYTCYSLLVFDLKKHCSTSSDLNSVSLQLLDTCLSGLATPTCPSEKVRPDQANLLTRRLIKLGVVTFMALSPDDREPFIIRMLECSTRLLCPSSTNLPIALCDKTIRWLLGLLFGLLASGLADCRARFSLTTNGILEVQKWLTGSMESSISPFALLIYSLAKVRLTYPESQLQTLFSEPEACLSVGGYVCPADADPTASDDCNIDLKSVWDVEEQMVELMDSTLECLLGMFDSDEPKSFICESCRQLLELLISVLAQSKGPGIHELLSHLMMNLQNQVSTPLDSEVVLRIAQLCSPFMCQNTEFRAIIESLISTNLALIESKLTIVENPPVLQHHLALLATRLLCVLPRYAMYGASEGKSDSSHQCYQLTFSWIERLMNLTSAHLINDGGVLCVRLSAAHALHWLLGHPPFPIEMLSVQLVPFTQSLFKLITEVSQCETRVFLLDIFSALLTACKSHAHPPFLLELFNMLDQLWRMSSAETTMRIHILDLMSSILQTFNPHLSSDQAMAEFFTSIHTSLVPLVQTCLGDIFNLSGSDEALLAPTLRLWHNLMVTSSPAALSIVERLFPWLCGQATANHGVPHPALIHRLDSVDDCEVLFEIAEGYLTFLCKSQKDVGLQFLTRWTEPFWSAILEASEATGTLSSLCSSVRTLHRGVEHTDKESPCRVRQLSLMSHWLSVYLDKVHHQPHTCDTTVAIPSSLACLVVVAIQSSIFRSPPSEHDDICPLATQMGLNVCGRLAGCCSTHWITFLRLLTFAHENLESSDHLGQMRLRLPNAASQLNMDTISVCELIERCLKRWLDRLDSILMHIDRWCVVVACMRSITQCSVFSTQPGDLHPEHVAMRNAIHVQFLEPVLNACVQILCDEPREDPDNAGSYHPEELTTRNGLVEQLNSIFATWQQAVGGAEAAQAMFNLHVDPTIRTQLEASLFLTNG